MEDERALPALLIADASELSFPSTPANKRHIVNLLMLGFQLNSKQNLWIHFKNKNKWIHILIAKYFVQLCTCSVCLQSKKYKGKGNTRMSQLCLPVLEWAEISTSALFTCWLTLPLLIINLHWLLEAFRNSWSSHINDNFTVFPASAGNKCVFLVVTIAKVCGALVHLLCLCVDSQLDWDDLSSE